MKCKPVKEYQVKSDIPEEGRKIDCSCGEKRIVHDWYWAVHNKNPTLTLEFMLEKLLERGLIVEFFKHGSFRKAKIVRVGRPDIWIAVDTTPTLALRGAVEKLMEAETEER